LGEVVTATSKGERVGASARRTRITVLGSGDAFGSGGRGHSAYLVDTPSSTFLLDCGPTVLQSLKHAGREPGEIDFVLLSHLHGDHFGGVPFLFLEYRYESPRSRPLDIYGPRDTQRRVEGLFAALYEDAVCKPAPFSVRYTEIAPGTTTAAAGVRIASFRVPHVSDLMCFGYRLEIGDRTVLYSGDSGWTDEFVAQARGVDLFLCECSTYETSLPIHISYPEIAAHAAQLGCRRMLLTHLGSETLRHLDELSLECARDGQTIDL
jgi:ribonuclease BN (tRNA processing enzyme)